MENIRTTMSGCTETGETLISILMAVYEPRMDWLREQLLSLEAQTYSELRLYVRDDCSPTVSFDEIQSCVRDCIRSFPYEIRRNERNLGSNGTFELLTQEAEGEYFAYCDQDDVWLPEKLTVLKETLEKTGAELVCSDMYVIDKDGNQTADSITKVRRHHRFRSGDGLAPKLLISNFVTGCTMLVRSSEAKAALPFCPYMVHDHYLALWCAEHGRIEAITKPLICYRIHDGNQTGLLAGVRDKKSYFNVRIKSMVQRLSWLQEFFPAGPTLSSEIATALLWAESRAKNFNGDHHKKWVILKYRRYSLLTSLFETLFSGAPEPLFMNVVELNRKNRI